LQRLNSNLLRTSPVLTNSHFRGVPHFHRFAFRPMSRNSVFVRACLSQTLSRSS
jgi:hypothetical protein